jgi:hypothetical protein
MTTQEFLETHLPNYYTRDDVTYLDDLHRLLDSEYEDGDDADRVLQSEFGGDLARAYPLVQQKVIEVEHMLLVEAIQNVMV